jgi:hypothetical protein
MLGFPRYRPGCALAILTLIVGQGLLVSCYKMKLSTLYNIRNCMTLVLPCCSKTMHCGMMHQYALHLQPKILASTTLQSKLKMQFPSEISGVAGIVLLDSGASEMYVSKEFAGRCNISYVPARGYMKATTANGGALSIVGMAVVHLTLTSLKCKVRCWVAEVAS